MTTTEKEQVVRDHIAKYQIHFRGSADEEKWPLKYTELFRQVREIGQRDYHQMKGARTLTRKQRSQVHQLVQHAGSERQDPAGEASLRETTEPIVFESLLDEAKCVTCMNYRRLPERLAWQFDRVGNLRLKPYTVQYTGCRCSVASQSADSPLHLAELKTFHARGNQIVKPDESEASDINATVGHKRPDKIFGLYKTPTFSHYIAEQSVSIRHTPLSNSKLLYPFLVVEAKGPQGCKATFHNIETQSAFPLRTCLQLQQKLQDSSQVSLNPLVWFLAYQGDIYSLSGCIFLEGQTLIHDLWIGRATSRNGALQLLSLINFISVWARYVYKEEVLACLAGARAELQRLSPNLTRSESQAVESAPQQSLTVLESRNNSVLYADEVAETASIIDLTVDECPVNHCAGESIHEQPSSSMPAALHPWLKWAPLEIAGFASSRRATIRHIDMVSMHFVHLSFPEERQRLVKCLKRLKDMSGDTIESIARSVLSALMDREGVLITTHNRISIEGQYWLRDHAMKANDSKTLLRAVFGFRTSVKRTDWSIIRQLWCMSCSTNAAQLLASVAGMDDDASAATARIAVPLDGIPPHVFDWLRRLPGESALSAALHSNPLYLAGCTTEHDSKEYEWVSTNSAVGLLTQSLLAIAQDALNGGSGFDTIDDGHQVMEVLSGGLPQSVKCLFPTQPVIGCGAILLHKGSYRNDNVPDWCLMILNDIDFADSLALADLLETVLSRNDVLILVEGGYLHGLQHLETITRDTDAENQVLREWLSDLRGK